jgi:hypothetical protein
MNRLLFSKPTSHKSSDSIPFDSTDPECQPISLLNCAANSDISNGSYNDENIQEEDLNTKELCIRKAVKSVKFNFIKVKDDRTFIRNNGECSYSPDKVNAKTSRFDKLYNEAKSRWSYKGLTTREKLEQESLKECTFKPSINQWLRNYLNVTRGVETNKILYEQDKKRYNKVHLYNQS